MMMNKLTVLFPALSVSNFRRYWITQWIALLGFWLQMTAQQWLVYEMTDSAVLLGLVSAAQFTPSFLFSIGAGLVIDRYSRRKILVVTQFCYILQALALSFLLWSGHASYGWILFLAFFLGSIDAVDMPTRLAFMPELVGGEKLRSAVSLNSANFNIARMIGPAMAAVLMSHMDYGWLFFLNAVSLLPILYMYSVMKVAELPHTSKGNAWSEMKDGLRYARNSRTISGSLLCMAVVSTLILNFGTYGPLFADRVLHQGLTGFGAVLTAIGVGSLAGGLFSATGKGRPDSRVLFYSALLSGFSLMAVSFVSFYWAALFLFALLGLFSIIFMINCNTSIQMASPPSYHGRVMSLYTFVFLGTAPFGSLLVSSAMEIMGTSEGMMAAGAIAAASIFLIGILYRMHRRNG